MKERLVGDTSIVIDGKMPDIIEGRTPDELIVPYVVLDELQAQASKGREEGYIGLEELKKIRGICGTKGIKLRFLGERPSLEEIRLSRGGRLDALIRDIAKEEDAVLVTADYVQSLVGEAEGLKTEYIPKRFQRSKLSFKDFFTEHTMSIHLKGGAPPYAKKGQPGRFSLVKIRKKSLSEGELKRIIREITDAARREEDSFIEIDEGGVTVVQLGEYRVAMAKPPFSDGLEVTVVRPLVKLGLKDYDLSEKLMDRLKERGGGNPDRGPPGIG